MEYTAVVRLAMYSGTAAANIVDLDSDVSANDDAKYSDILRAMIPQQSSFAVTHRNATS
jgi:hypothetical protein